VCHNAVVLRRAMKSKNGRTDSKNCAKCSSPQNWNGVTSLPKTKKFARQTFRSDYKYTTHNTHNIHNTVPSKKQNTPYAVFISSECCACCCFTLFWTKSHCCSCDTAIAKFPKRKTSPQKRSGYSTLSLPKTPPFNHRRASLIFRKSKTSSNYFSSNISKFPSFPFTGTPSLRLSLSPVLSSALCLDFVMPKFHLSPCSQVLNI